MGPIVSKKKISLFSRERVEYKYVLVVQKYLLNTFSYLMLKTVHLTFDSNSDTSQTG